jgi:hypothetical protein
LKQEGTTKGVPKSSLKTFEKNAVTNAPPNSAVGGPIAAERGEERDGEAMCVEIEACGRIFCLID